MQGTNRIWERTVEAARWVLLSATALWLSKGYFSPRLIGTADALWYQNLLADAVTQFRAGVFPVYVGQSPYSFNGAIYPIRAAPYFQYLCGLLDWTTGRSLSFFALQHLTVVVSFVGGALVTYFALLWVAPLRRWSAFFLALLYLLCPGVAGLFYAQDLYMSGMTIPWLPLVFASLVRSFDDKGLFPRAVLAASLAVLWWAHSPIALWATSIAALGQCLRFIVARPDRTDVIRGGIAAAIFCLLAAYPIISVFLLRSHGEPIVPYTMDRALLMQWITNSFPSSVQPLRQGALGINHLQLGYSLWFIFVLGVAVWWTRARNWAVGSLLVAAAFLLLLVFPVPWITRALWFAFPETVVGMTLYWPMQRFYILIAAAIVVGAQRQLMDPMRPKLAARLCAFVLLLAMTLWSGKEASKLIRQASLQDGTVEESRRWALTENVAVQRHTYGLFPRKPDYFSHGVLDPTMEAHLLDPVTEAVLASDYDLSSAFPPKEAFRGKIDANPGILNLEPELKLLPGRRYFLTFEFTNPSTTGVLQMSGEDSYREYVLPQSGESKSFGAGPENEKSIVLWTSLSHPVALRLRFIATGAKGLAKDYLPFARFNLHPIDGEELPIRVQSLIPYTAVVRSPGPALLESPRMFVPGYAAEVNGASADVRKSKEGLVAFLVPRGESRVVLRFVGPPLLRVAFWTSAVGWFLAVSAGIIWFRRRPANESQFLKS